MIVAGCDVGSLTAKAGVPTLISYSDSFDPRIESADTMLDKLL